MKKINPISKYFLTLISMLRSNIRDYGMYIALAVIFIIFSILTGGNFLKPTNFTNLLNQTAYVSVLAVGMTLVIVTRQIDLSVGYLGAFLGAYVVVSVQVNGQPVLFALGTALLLTIFVGLIKGLLIAKVKIPSFVVTLAGMFIFKGLLMLKTDNRTIPTTNNFFNKVGVGYLTENTVGTIDTLTFVVGIVLIAAIILFGILKRHKNKKLGIPLEKLELFITKLLIMSVLIFFITFTLARFRGISFLLLITAVIVVIYHIFTTQTVLGRRIYAVGGNPEAAELSGISVEKTLIIVFVSMGILALFSGVMYASMLQTTSPNHGPFWELYAIAAAYIGGTSANGGVGKVVNAVIGSIVIMSLKNGMALAAVNSNIEPIVLGSVLLLAVIFDVYTRNVRGADLIGMHYAKEELKEQYIAAKNRLHDAKRVLTEALKVDKKHIKEKYLGLLKVTKEKYKNDLKVLADELHQAKEQKQTNTVQELNDKIQKLKAKYVNEKQSIQTDYAKAKDTNGANIIDLEYNYTSALGEYNRIKDTIRSSVEEEFTKVPSVYKSKVLKACSKEYKAYITLKEEIKKLINSKKDQEASDKKLTSQQISMKKKELSKLKVQYLKAKKAAEKETKAELKLLKKQKAAAIKATKNDAKDKKRALKKAEKDSDAFVKLKKQYEETLKVLRSTKDQLLTINDVVVKQK